LLEKKNNYFIFVSPFTVQTKLYVLSLALKLADEFW